MQLLHREEPYPGNTAEREDRLPGRSGAGQGIGRQRDADSGAGGAEGIALEEGGISRWGWSQNSLITVNKENKTYHYNHEYYLIRHFSQFVKPGAKLLVSSGEFNDILAFENPDKSVVVVLSNEGETDKTITFGIGGKNYSAQLKANSFNTVVIE